MDLSQPCILWHKSSGSHGYPQMWRDGTIKLVHRVLWEDTYGPIPEDMTVDHGCREKQCIQVEHYQLKTNPDNARDGAKHYHLYSEGTASASVPKPIPRIPLSSMDFVGHLFAADSAAPT